MHISLIMVLLKLVKGDNVYVVQLNGTRGRQLLTLVTCHTVQMHPSAVIAFGLVTTLLLKTLSHAE